MSMDLTNDIESGGTSPKEYDEPTEILLIKEKFAKLLLGEDMSGGGKGVSSALALSNAITELAASTFGELWKLEPLSPDKKERWQKEIDWILSVTDHIVEFAPSKQTAEDGTVMEVMMTKQRHDLLVNMPTLKKIDAVLVGCLDDFKGGHEFYYITKSETNKIVGRKRKDDNHNKWWIPTPKIPPKGLTKRTRKWLLNHKESMGEVLKLANAINAEVLAEMEIPESYIESLPKNGRASLGDSMYKSITDDNFDPEDFLSDINLSSEQKVLDIKNRLEASVIIWKRKMIAKDGKSGWSSSVSAEKRELFEERAESILLILKERFPRLSRSALDASKIKCNNDVGYGVLESYSRTLEASAFTVLSRLDDVIQADRLIRGLKPN